MGEPKHPDELTNHECIRDTNGIDPSSWPFVIGEVLHRVQISGRFSANSANACLNFARAGSGLIQCPDVFLTDDLNSGALVEVLQGYPSAAINIQIVHLPTLLRPIKVTAFQDFLLQRYRTHCHHPL